MKPRFVVLPLLAVVVVIGLFTLQPAAASTASTESVRAGGQKTGVLLVSHGSRSRRWREMLLEVEERVCERVLANGDISGLRSAFMEYTEPSIATRLKEFDAEGYTDVILVPLLLTVSSHSFDDIPTIYGGKRDAHSAAELQSEGIEMYDARCNVHMTPLLDFPAMLEQNVLRRVSKLSRDPKEEGVVLVAYGDAGYDEEWQQLMSRLGESLRRETAITATTHAWCGHLVHYETQPTKAAIGRILQTKNRALVVPILVAIDEMFQHKIIGGAVQETGQTDRIAYRPDSILPDPNLDRWVVDIVGKTLSGMPEESRSR